MDRKSDSKSNLNESTLPLLDEDVNKEKIELLDQADKAAEANETNVDGTKTDDAVDAAKKKKEEEKERKRQQKLEEEEKKKQQKLEKQKKKEEEKELKKQQEAEKKAAKEAAKEAAKANGSANVSGGNNVASGCKNWNAYNQFTVGINLLDRDERSVNEHVNVNFEDIIGEPDAAQGFDGAYRLSFGLFQFIRFWVYRILMTILSVPFALIWAVIFALLSLVSVWVLTPAFRVLDIFFYFVHRLWNALVRTFLDPVFTSVSLLRQDGAKPLNHTPVPTHSGKSVYRSGVKYNQLSASETVASYTKTGDDDHVALSLDSALN